MTTDTDALRAQFEKLVSDSGRACFYAGDGQYAYPHDFSWLCYQAGHAAAQAETAAAVAKERERAAMVCERIADDYNRREGLKYPELKTDAETGANDCADAIRAGAKETSDG